VIFPGAQFSYLFRIGFFFSSSSSSILRVSEKGSVW